jgi:hypothetical protein
LDAPPGGGLWCVELGPGWLPQEGYAETTITGQTGNNVYELGSWIKTNSQWFGSISLRQWRNGIKISDKSIHDTSAVWKHISFLDTLNVLATDTLKVHLSAGSTEVVYGSIRFDRVTLIKQ